MQRIKKMFQSRHCTWIRIRVSIGNNTGYTEYCEYCIARTEWHKLCILYIYKVPSKH